MAVLKTTSPVDCPSKPMDCPLKRLPSSSANKAGLVNLLSCCAYNRRVPGNPPVEKIPIYYEVITSALQPVGRIL
jgi:hypothetical protein